MHACGHQDGVTLSRESLERPFHVNGSQSRNAGPNEDTISDFWRMIWEKKSYVVVMLTKVFDFIRVSHLSLFFAYVTYTLVVLCLLEERAHASYVN